MEIFLLLVLIAIILFQNNSISNQLESIRARLWQLEENKVKAPPAPFVEKESEPSAPFLVEVEEKVSEPPKAVFTTFETLSSYEVDVIEPDEPEQERTESAIPEWPQKMSWWEQFSKNNPDMERFIGENLVSKIGIAILVLGIAFFVKYAIDKEWINETARVGIGILAGSIVLGFAHRLHVNFKAFSSVLVSGGISVYYFTLAIGFQEYHVFSQSMAFAMMVAVTAFSVFISLKYSRQELAILSLIGGFATPLMVSTGEGNYIVLFSYLLILDLGILVLSYFRNWNLLNILTYLFTLILYGLWLNEKILPMHEFAPYVGALCFATAFYLVFTASNFINQIKEKRAFKSIELSLILSNTFLYFACGMAILNAYHPALKGAFTLALAIFNLLLTYSVRKNEKIDKNLFYLLIGLTLTFITLVAPIQLKGHYITLFWAAEGVLLLWLSQRSKLEVYRYISLLIIFLSVFSLVMDWNKLYGTGYGETFLVLLNPAFLSSAFVLASLIGYRYLLKQEENQDHVLYEMEFHNERVGKWLLYLLIPMGYFSGFFESNYHFRQIFNFDLQTQIYLLSYHLLFSALLLYFAKVKQLPLYKTAVIYLGLLNLFIYILFFGFMANDEITRLLGQEGIAYGYWAHYLCIPPFVYQMVCLYKLSKPANPKLTAWLMVIILTYLFGAELIMQRLYFSLNALLEANQINSSGYELMQQMIQTVVKSGLPVLWGILAFVFLSLGIRRGYRALRIASLTLIGVTVVKLFLYDIRNVSEGGKIAAFILLGLVLLVISFTYQKIKSIILDEEEVGDET